MLVLHSLQIQVMPLHRPPPRRTAFALSWICEKLLRELDTHKFEEKAKLLDDAGYKALFVPGNKLLSMFDPATWTKCFSEFWYGDALPNMSKKKQNPTLTFEELFRTLPDREELE